MRKNEGRVIGILGTVIIHLIAGIIFMSFQINSLHKDLSHEFTVEFAPSEETDEKEKLIELPAISLDKILQGDEEMLNIARNLANKPLEQINPDDYINMVKEELIKSGKLGEDNYIDDQNKLNDQDDEERLSYDNNSTDKEQNDDPTESQKMASNYSGPTRIYYNLPGRTQRYLPLPIYKCQGAGKVVLSIDVNQKGVVEKAMVVGNESSTSDPCLLETAVATALISRFNSDINSPKIQTGTLTYHFVAQ
jgi:hypothetical protein